MDESSASAGGTSKVTKGIPRRSGKSTSQSPVNLAGSSGSTAKVSGNDDAAVVPRGSSRLREKGKVVYSARRGVIKPGKRNADDGGEGQRPRKRAAT